MRKSVLNGLVIALQCRYEYLILEGHRGRTGDTEGTGYVTVFDGQLTMLDMCVHRSLKKRTRGLGAGLWLC